MTHIALQLQKTLAKRPAIQMRFSIKSSTIACPFRFLYEAAANGIPVRRRPNPVHLHDRKASPGGVVE